MSSYGTGAFPDEDRRRTRRDWRVAYGLFDPVMIVLAVATVPLSAWGVLRAAVDISVDSALTGFLLSFTSCVPTAWSVLSAIWARDPDARGVLPALGRCVAIPLVTSWIPAVTTAVTVHLPSINARIVAQRETIEYPYFFSKDDGSLLAQTLGLSWIAGLAIAMLVGLALGVFVVLPVLAWVKPRMTAAENQMDVSDEDTARANTKAVRAIALVIVLIFAIPSCIVFGAQYGTADSVAEAFTLIGPFLAHPGEYGFDMLRILGILLIPVGIIAVGLVVRWRRPGPGRR